MTDIYDQATAREELDRGDCVAADAVFRRRCRMECNNREASCVGACDSDCRSDFEVRERMAKINGRV